MTRNVRPSWIELEVEGRKSNIATGPGSRNGNMYIALKVRKDEMIHDFGQINFFATGDQVKVEILIPDLDINETIVYNQ